MKSYDIAIVGASTAGSYFARRMAERGFSVLVIDSCKQAEISPAYDIFHMSKGEMAQFGLPAVEDGDGVKAFEYKPMAHYSAFGHYPKPSVDDNVGLHKRAYIRKMNAWAAEAGAEFQFEAPFKALTYDDKGKINGLTFTQYGEEITVRCRLAVDCSGIPAVVRRSLPKDYGMETFALTERDVFFVTLHYVRFKEQLPPFLHSDFWLAYKSWLAPSGEENGAILGTGAGGSYENCDKTCAMLRKNVKLPEFEITRTERGITPYHRTVYSFVSDGFLVMGDAASLTKPFNGEGCTANMVLADIAVAVAEEVMQGGAYPTREAMWRINKQYMDKQGKDFTLLQGVLIHAIRHSLKANEYMFKHDCIMSKKIMGGFADGATINAWDIGKTVFFILFGLATGNLKPKELGEMFGGAFKAIKLSNHYGKYPETPALFDDWVKTADELWSKIGNICDFSAF